MDPTDPFSTPPLTIGGLPIQTTPLGALDDSQLMARLLAAYPSEIYEGWTPPPPSQDAAAQASPVMQIGFSQLYPDLFGHLAPPLATDSFQLDDSGAPPVGSQDPGQTQSSTPPGAPNGVLPPQPIQLAPAIGASLTPAPQLGTVSDQDLDFTPTFPGAPGAAAYGRVGLTRNADGIQSFGGLAPPGHATPAGQILRDGEDPTAAVNLSSPSADELSLKPVVQNGRLQMGIYDDTTRERWIADSTPGQSATFHNAKGEPIVFTSTDVTAPNGAWGSNPVTEFVSGMSDSQADDNTFNLRPGRGLSHNLGYQESKVEGALNLAAPVKDLALVGGSKFAAIAGIGKAAGKEVDEGLDAAAELQEYRQAGGHHIPAQSVMREAPGYNPGKALTIPKAEMDRLGLYHSDVTTAQMAGYRALKSAGVPMSWDVAEEVETRALIQKGVDSKVARATARKAIAHLKDSGVGAPTRYPGRS